MTNYEVIPTRFWKSLTPDEWDRIVLNNGELDALLCAKLWRMQDRQGEPPQRLGVLVRTSDTAGKRAE